MAAASRSRRRPRGISSNSVINNKGVIEANSVGTRAGRIVLGGATQTAGLPKQTIKISGTITATGKDKGSKGGTIQITGEDIQFAAAMIDASGHSGGGKILVGGDYGGGRPIPGVVNNQSAVLENHAIATASTVTVDSATTFNASATVNGNGGKVILWSDVLTTFAGTIFARGGDLGGNGGFVEVSGKQRLAYTGLVDTRAPNGQAGTLLLDPEEFNIDSAAAATIVANLSTTDVIITTGATGVGTGDITVNASIAWSTSHGLTLSAYRNVVVNANITNTTGDAPVTLRADNTGTGTGTVSFAAGAAISTQGNVAIFYNPTSYTSPNDYTGNVISGGLTAYMLVNTVTDLDNVRTNLGGTYALGRDIDATGTGGFTPIGNDNGPVASFRGLFDGQNWTISGLTIDASSGVAGLFGFNSGTIQNVNLVNVTVAATKDGQVLGGLVGHNEASGTISNVSVSGTVGGLFNSLLSGGLVGLNNGTISDSYALANVSGGGMSRVGGLVGQNGSFGGGSVATITNSHASGDVVVSGEQSAAGGLVGRNTFGSTITGSYASGAVTGSGTVTVGGFIGENSGNVTSSHATGAVTVANKGAVAGGFVGSNSNSGNISRSYATGQVAVMNNGAFDAIAGGFVGTNTGSISNSYASGAVSGTNGDVMLGGFAGLNFGSIITAYATGDVTTNSALATLGGFTGGNSGTITQSYATGRVGTGTASALTGGFAGWNFGQIKLSYWDTGTSGLTNAVGTGSNGGITGLTTAQARTQSSYVGFDFSSSEGAWFMIDGQTRPFLQMEHSTTIRNAHQLQLMAMNPAANYVLAGNIDFTGQFGESGMWGSRGFSPVGRIDQRGNNPFTGSLDGQGFTINALMLAPNNATTQSVGLFGTIGADGSVMNLNITNASVAANIGLQQPVEGGPVSQWVGILAGQSGGTITNVTVAGTVSGLSMSGVIAGGLVGQHGILGPNSSAGTITNAHANVNVTVADGMTCPGTCMFNAAGGLVGVNVGGSSIANSSAAGNVSGGAFTWAGGLVGQNGFFNPANSSGTITNSFATGNVSVAGLDSAAGGLVGSNVPGSTITGSHATGAVAASGGATAGGFVGENHGTITTSYATGPVTLTNSGATDAVAGGFAGTNEGTISGSHATGAVTSTNGDVTLGGFVGVNSNGITNSYATGNVTANGATLAMLGGFAGGNAGTITQSHATGNVSTNAATAMAGGFVGLNFGEITLSYATGNVAVGNNSFAGGFVGFNFGTINQAYAQGAVTAGANSFAGGFVGANAAADLSQFDPAAVAAPAASPGAGSITQSYALGSVTGGNATVVAAFAALNLGSLDQVYGAGRVQGGTSSTLGGLVGSSNATLALPSLFDGPAPVFSPGTTTNSYWDMQTTGLTTSAGGTGLNTAALVGGLPSGFDSNVWGNPAYPYLLNLGLQNTDPGTPVIPPVGGNDPLPANLPPADQQINPNVINPLAANDPVPNVTQFVEQQQQQQQRQAQSAQQTTGSIAQDPIRLEVGENRYFYLPPATETRLVSDEVVLQLPCNVPQAAVETVLKQHNLTVLASQCLAEGGNAAFRIRYSSGQTISSVIRALADHQVVVAAQANYTYELTETKVQSATSQQGDPGQYVPEKLRLYSAHRIVTGNNVSIGVIDSEIDGAHPDLTGAIANKYDATGIDDNPHAHGTGMAGAIVSHQKLLGVAPGAQILAIRAFSTRNANPESTTFHILRGLDYAVANNVRIVNMSFAGPRDPSLERALKAAHDKGVVLIAAAGNAGPRAPAMYPAADPHVIAVTATDVDDRLFPGANRGNHVAIAAPGVDILVPAPAGEYQVTTGTSVATAHISGVVALMLERNPRLTPVDVRRILVATAKRIGPANMFGAGLVDTMKAIEMATPRSTEAPAPATTRPTTTAAAVRP